jgi:hypothetical protein
MATATRIKSTTKKTSKASSKDNPVRRSQRFLLLEAYVEAGKAGLTAEQAADLTGLLIGTCYWKRVSELFQEGILNDTETTRMNASGREATILVVSSFGRNVFKSMKRATK